jgi:alkylation response protein AidB-like acyl-CoA dehydrogenase
MNTSLETRDLHDERHAFVDAIRDFAARECGNREQREHLTEQGLEAHNQQLYAKLAELGWIGCCLPEAYGGSGGGLFDMCLLLEELWRGLVPVQAVSTAMIVAKAVEKFASEEQKQEILGGICRGEVASIAMSEPGSGSDVGSLSCRAERDGQHYLINGQKTWISNAHLAKRILLICRTDRHAGKHGGLSMIDVPIDTPGVQTSLIPTIAGREVSDVYFTDARVPTERLIGTEHHAWKQLMAGLNAERLIIAAESLGQAQRTFDDALSFISEREQFGQPVGQFQVLRHRIADLATELHCTRLLVYDTARRADANPDRQLPREASMAKLKATELSKRIAIEGMQMLGGYGYATEHDMQRHLRFSIISTVYGGTSEIQRDIIGKTFGL